MMMKRIMIAAGAAVAVLALAGCGNSGAPSGGAPSYADGNTSVPSAQPSTGQTASAASDTSWPGVGPNGHTGTACDLLPWEAFSIVLPSQDLDPSWTGLPDYNWTGHGLVYNSVTTGNGDSGCQVYWQDQA